MEKSSLGQAQSNGVVFPWLEYRCLEMVDP